MYKIFLPKYLHFSNGLSILTDGNASRASLEKCGHIPVFGVIRWYGNTLHSARKY